MFLWVWPKLPDLGSGRPACRPDLRSSRQAGGDAMNTLALLEDPAGFALPALIERAGKSASLRFLEFAAYGPRRRCLPALVREARHCRAARGAAGSRCRLY